MLIVPLRHTGDVEDLTPDENAELQVLLQRSIRALREESEPHGFNVGMNLGSTRGGIPDHLHWHVVPRWNGDTNFMPVAGRSGCCPSCSPTPLAASARGSPMREGEDGFADLPHGGRLHYEIAGDRASPAVTLLHPGL